MTLVQGSAWCVHANGGRRRKRGFSDVWSADIDSIDLWSVIFVLLQAPFFLSSSLSHIVLSTAAARCQCQKVSLPLLIAWCRDSVRTDGGNPLVRKRTLCWGVRDHGFINLNLLWRTPFPAFGRTYSFSKNPTHSFINETPEPAINIEK